MKTKCILALCLIWSCSVNGQTGSAKIDQWITQAGTDYVIIDFFSSSCVACFKAMPHINELQQQFAGKMKFLLVGKEDDRIQTTYAKFKDKFNLQLDVLFDSVLQRQLNVTEYPSYLWIQDGKVLAKSYNYAVTAAHIRDFVDGRLATSTLTKAYAKFDLRKQWNELDNHAGAGPALLRSVLMPATDSTPYYSPPSINKQAVPGTFQAINVSGETLYNYAYFGAGNWTVVDSLYGKASPHAVLEIDNPDQLRKQQYCYTATIPGAAQSPQLIQQKLKDDLFALFGYSAHVEIREIPCLLLTATEPARHALRSKPTTKKPWVTHAGFAYYNAPVERVIRLLGVKLPKDMPIIDATGINYKIDLELSAVLIDLEDVRTNLQKQGLDLVSSTTPVKVLVIKEKNATATATAFSVQH